MAHFLIRPATQNDAHGIAEVHVKTWQYAYRGLVPDSFLDNMSVEKRAAVWKNSLEHPDEGVYLFIAEQDGKIVGWCGGGKNRDEDVNEDVGELHGIYINPDYIGKGIGSALMTKMLETLKIDGYKKATLWVLKTNQKAIEFYEKKGWHIEGRMKIEPREGFELHEVRYIRQL